MQSPNRSIVTGVFHSREKAESAISDLRNAGFSTSQIGIASKADTGDWPEYGALPQSYTGGDTIADDDTLTDEAETSRAAAGAGAGAAIGAGVGGLWALGIAAGLLPAIGPVVAGGLLGSLLASAAAGATAGGMVGGLIGLGIPEDEARYYEGEFNRGRVLVTVRTSDRFNEARRILRDHGAYDIEQQVSSSSSSLH